MPDVLKSITQEEINKIAVDSAYLNWVNPKAISAELRTYDSKRFAIVWIAQGESQERVYGFVSGKCRRSPLMKRKDADIVRNYLLRGKD